MATKISTGPALTKSQIDEANARLDLQEQSATKLKKAQALRDSSTSSDAYKNGTPELRAKIDAINNENISGAQKALNSTTTSDGNTRAQLDQLASDRQQAYNNVTLVDKEADPAGYQAAVDKAQATNQAYKDGIANATNNGGVLPGAPASDPGIGITATPDQPLPIPPIPPDQIPPVPGNQNNATDANFDDRQTADAPNTVSTTSTNLNSSNTISASAADGQIAGTQNNNITPSASAADGQVSQNDPANQATSSNTQVIDDSNSPQSNVNPQPNPAENVPIITMPDQRIRLTPKNMAILGDKNSILYPLSATLGFMFPYTPTLQYAGNVSYGTQALVHANQDFKPFSGTQSQTITINGIFTAQNQDEAKYVMACLHFLRTVTKMRFGQGSAIGLPPPVLVLNGYGLAVFNNLSVIITTFAMEMPNNVDYIKTTVAGIDAWIPTYCTITVSCTVQNTPNKQRTFNWDDFASGALLKKGGWS